MMRQQHLSEIGVEKTAPVNFEATTIHGSEDKTTTLDTTTMKPFGRISFHVNTAPSTDNRLPRPVAQIVIIPRARAPQWPPAPATNV